MGPALDRATDKSGESGLWLYAEERAAWFAPGGVREFTTQCSEFCAQRSGVSKKRVRSSCTPGAHGRAGGVHSDSSPGRRLTCHARRAGARSLTARAAFGPEVLSPDGAGCAEYTTNGRRLVRRVLESAGIARRDAPSRVVDIHALRPTAATRMARCRVPCVASRNGCSGMRRRRRPRRVSTPNLGRETRRECLERVSDLRRGREVLR